MTQFTQTEQRILLATANGEGHRVEVLLACFEDDTADKKNLGNVLYSLRKKLRPMGQDLIVQSFGRKVMYRRIRHLHSTDST